MANQETRRPRWLRRRKLYAGGALMVLAPFGGGCDEAATGQDAVAVAPTDIVADAPNDYVNYEGVAIAPWDPGKVDIAIAPDLNGDNANDPGQPEIIAIAPWDPGPEMIAIAPADVGVDDGGPIAIMPWDAGPEVIAIAPFDSGPTDVAPQACFVEGDWCDADTVCQAQAMCVVPTDCCGGCECKPLSCNPLVAGACPDPTTCQDDGNGKGHCTRNNVKPAPGGFMAVCTTDAECLQEYFCEQTMFCIAPAPGAKMAPPACGQMNCVPVACDLAAPACSNGATCMPYGFGTAGAQFPTCIRNAGGVEGGFFAKCSNTKPCAAQYQCQSSCPTGMMCIVATEVCLPVPCDITKGDCDVGSTCTSVGITDVCVENP